MKKASKYGLIMVMVLAFVFGSTNNVSAKPIDNGNNFFVILNDDQLWLDDTGIFWDFYFTDNFNETDDLLHIYGYDPTTDSIIVSSEFINPITSKINMRRGIAIFTSLNLDITLNFDTSIGEYYTSGSRKDGDMYYSYSGPATIKGTFTIDGTIYPINGTIDGTHTILINSSHYIEK